MMGKIVERFGMMTLIKIRDQKRVESKRIEDFSETMRDIGVKQARLGANIEVTADPVLMLSVFVTLYIGIAVLGMTLAQLGLLLFVLNRLNAKVKEFNHGPQGDLDEHGRAAAGQGAHGRRRGLEHDPVGPGALRGAQARDRADRRRVRVPRPPLPGRHDRVQGQVGAEGRVGDDPRRFVHGDRGPLGRRQVDARGAAAAPCATPTPAPSRSTASTSRSSNVGSLRKGIGYLTQSAMLFNDSVRENLIYGLDFEPTEEQIRDALEGAYASFVYDLPHGLETKLGDRGVRFSGGERQRIGLARVLLDGSSILILDEPTSALDSESEVYIQEALAKLSGKKTIIVIAHRLATVIKADQLLVVDDGQDRRARHARGAGRPGGGVPEAVREPVDGVARRRARRRCFDTRRGTRRPSAPACSALPRAALPQ